MKKLILIGVLLASSQIAMAVNWWQQGQVSVIKLDFHVAGGVLFNTNGTDQQGRRWQLSDNSYGVCF